MKQKKKSKNTLSVFSLYGFYGVIYLEINFSSFVIAFLSKKEDISFFLECIKLNKLKLLCQKCITLYIVNNINFKFILLLRLQFLARCNLRHVVQKNGVSYFLSTISNVKLEKMFNICLLTTLSYLMI